MLVLCYFVNSIFLSNILSLLIVISAGHVRTFCKFLRDSSDRCLEKALAVLARIFETEKISGACVTSEPMFCNIYLPRISPHFDDILVNTVSYTIWYVL